MAKADVAELVDARDLKSLDGNVVWVRLPPPAPGRFFIDQTVYIAERRWMEFVCGAKSNQSPEMIFTKY